MVRKSAVDVSDMTMNQAWKAIGLLGKSVFIDKKNGVRNPVMNPTSAQYDLAGAAQRRRMKAKFAKVVKGFLSRGGWKFVGDIGLQDYENIIRMTYELEYIPDDIRGKFQVAAHICSPVF